MLRQGGYIALPHHGVALMEVKYWYLEHRPWGSCLYRLDTFTLVKLAILVILFILATLVYCCYCYCANDRTLYRTASLPGLVGALRSAKTLAN